MNIIVSPSEIGLICKAIQSKMYQYEIGSQMRNDYSVLLGMLCDEVELHFRKLGQQDMYSQWLHDNDLITPY